MKHTILLLLLLTISKLDGQVSIGASTARDAAILDVVSSTKGVLFPRVELLSLDNKAPLTGNIPNGTLIFNTKINGYGVNKVFRGYYEWYNNAWKPLIPYSTINSVAKFLNNPNETTNWHPASTGINSSLNVSLFSSTDFNDDTTLYERIDDSSIKINEVGTYAVTTNIGFQLMPINTRNSTIEIYFNYTLDGVIASSRVLSRVPQQETLINGRFFYNLIDYITVTKPGEVLTLQASRNNPYNSGSQQIIYDKDVSSSIVIQKLR